MRMRRAATAQQQFVPGAAKEEARTTIQGGT